MAHWRKVAVLIVVMTLYFVLFGVFLGFGRLESEFWPLDTSDIGSSVYASFVWLPIAFLGGWILGEVRSERNLEKQRQLLEAHAAHIDKQLEAHHLRMAQLLGVTDKATGDALSATPGDRSLNEV